MLLFLTFDTEEEKNKFEELYQAYEKLMLYIALHITGNKIDAEDAVQNAFISIIKNFDKISEPVCPKTKAFVVIITERKALDIYRKRKRYQTESLDDPDIALPGMDLSESHAEQDYIASAIMKLPANYRDALLLKYSYGFSISKIADTLDVSEAAAYKIIERAKIKLEKLLEEEK